MNTQQAYRDFTTRLKLLISKHPALITTTLSNIFTMRLIGNKTHGDLAEIAMAEFINQYMYDFRSIHVGKDLYRAKSQEEYIKIINEITKAEFPVSLKAYGDGPLQLSTDKNSLMFPRLLKEKDDVTGKVRVKAIFDDPCFVAFNNINVLPLIYDEKKQRCNILIFDYEKLGMRQLALHGRPKVKGESIRCSGSMTELGTTFARSGMAMPQQMLSSVDSGHTRGML
jgi:hypothetical protein